ncbi:MAG TPA: ABC transporter ATP-binding protein [Spirochaetia bacterium]|nr:ABC transporter ATP-binding protein [Spirochaetales bacterium]HRY73081.1 ABC transporter ATP-binding protein [Spirochaetia bacterium]
MSGRDDKRSQAATGPAKTAAAAPGAQTASGAAAAPILEAKDLSISFSLRGRRLRAVRGASLSLRAGETLAVVGESGSGKSVLSKSFLGMLDKNGRVDSGSILFGGEDLAAYTKERQWLQVRGKRIAMIFQDPMTALNPLKTVGEQIREAAALHRGLDRKTSRLAVLETLERVGIAEPEARYRQYPHEFSGGMRQRAVIAAAVACRPEVLICDEPTTALDVTVQAQILDLLKSLQKDFGMSILFITHDLGVVAKVADRVAVMYAGQVIEEGLSREVFYDPRCPYTWALLASLPQLGVKGEELYSIKGTPPSLFKEIKGDAFAPRNPKALLVDYEAEPPVFEVSPTHWARTWLLDPRAPRVEAPDTIARLRGRLEARAAADAGARGPGEGGKA